MRTAILVILALIALTVGLPPLLRFWLHWPWGLALLPDWLLLGALAVVAAFIWWLNYIGFDPG